MNEKLFDEGLCNESASLGRKVAYFKLDQSRVGKQFGLVSLPHFFEVRIIGETGYLLLCFVDVLFKIADVMTIDHSDDYGVRNDCFLDGAHGVRVLKL